MRLETAQISCFGPCRAQPVLKHRPIEAWAKAFEVAEYKLFISGSILQPDDDPQVLSGGGQRRYIGQPFKSLIEKRDLLKAAVENHIFAREKILQSVLSSTRSCASLRNTCKLETI